MINSNQTSEEGRITASCGHKVHNTEDLVDVQFPDSVVDHDAGEFCDVTVYAVYCKSCAEVLNTQEKKADE